MKLSVALAAIFVGLFVCASSAYEDPLSPPGLIPRRSLRRSSRDGGPSDDHSGNSRGKRGDDDDDDDDSKGKGKGKGGSKGDDDDDDDSKGKGKGGSKGDGDDDDDSKGKGKGKGGSKGDDDDDDDDSGGKGKGKGKGGNDDDDDDSKGKGKGKGGNIRITNPTVKPTPMSTSKKPTLKPTTADPSSKPTLVPTLQPTTRKPTLVPTLHPTTRKPTLVPTLQPTTRKPTLLPTSKPTDPPTKCSLAGFNGIDFTLNGNATFTDECCLRLTEEITEQRGSAFAVTALDETTDYSFNAMYEYKITNALQNIADGITFVVHADPEGLNALGKGGGALGIYDRVNGFGTIKSALVIELDTYKNQYVNTGSTSPFDSYDRAVDVILIDDSGNTTRISETNIGINGTGTFTLQGTIWISYDGTTLDIYIAPQGSPKPGLPTVSEILDLSSLFGSSDDICVGFTAATGGAYDMHEICSFSFEELGSS